VRTVAHRRSARALQHPAIRCRIASALNVWPSAVDATDPIRALRVLVRCQRCLCDVVASRRSAADGCWAGSDGPSSCRHHRRTGLRKPVPNRTVATLGRAPIGGPARRRAGDKPTVGGDACGHRSFASTIGRSPTSPANGPTRPWLSSVCPRHVRVFRESARTGS